MLETKIKEVEEKEVFPALYASEKRETVILVKKISGDGKLEGVALHPKNQWGDYSMTWPSAKFKRLPRGSEFTLRFTQE